MWQRIRTALVLLVVVGFAMFATQIAYPILTLLAVMVAVAGYEWAKLIPNHTQAFSYGYALVLAVSSALLNWLMLDKGTTVLPITLGLAVATWLPCIVWVINYPNKTKHWHNNCLTVLGALLLPATALAMYFLWRISPWWLLYVFLLVWCADSGAYFVGRKFGKRKLAPKVSPNKSVEGLLGGLLLGGLVAFGVTLTQWQRWGAGVALGFLSLSLITIVVSVFGDLFESMLKREAGVKDSGRILPGHGGVLDRIDSQLSAMPVFAFGWYWLGFFGWY